MQDLEKLRDTIRGADKTLFILCGLPYAGKSYVADAVRNQTDVVYVSIDTIFSNRGFDWTLNNLPTSDAWQQIFDESYEDVREALRHGKNVLYDSTNHTLASRNKLREVASSVGAHAIVLHIASPVETVWRRWEENRENPTRSTVSKELVQQTIDMFEEPTERENAIVISNP